MGHPWQAGLGWLPELNKERSCPLQPLALSSLGRAGADRDS